MSEGRSARRRPSAPVRWAIGGLVVAAGALAPSAALATGAPVGTSIRVEYADPAFVDHVYLTSDGAPGVRDYPRSESYRDVVRDHYGSVTPENELQFWSVWPRAGEGPDFAPADRIVEWARSLDKRIRGHSLVFDDAVPAWLRNGGYSPRALGNIMRLNIRSVVGRYRGVIGEWDVVNEPLAEDGSFKSTVWSPARARSSTPTIRGVPRYITEAFRTARQADPGARLCLNEIGAEAPGPKSNGLFRLAAALKRLGLLDCVGFQGHFGPEKPVPDGERLESNLRRFGALGLDVEFTELDVAIDRTPPGAADPNIVWLASQRAIQSAAYHTVARACAEIAACTRITTWGASDDNSWRGASVEPSLIWRHMAAKPAYWDLVSTLIRAKGSR